MVQSILLILSLIGGIGLCLYGMKVMSEGILKISGSHIRASLRTLSTHRINCLWFGTSVTALIQSSSAMIMMALGFVNSGLITLSQSIAIVMGANIGTTITAWIIALFGYCLPIGSIAIPFIVISLPFLFSSHIKRKVWGEVLIGISLMILGFSSFISLMPSTDEYREILNFLSMLSSGAFGSVLLFVIIGVLVTMIFESSAATIMVAMALYSSSWLSLPMALALVIGDNVGTTLTSVIASKKANIAARRVAYTHLLFNLIGLVWSLALIYPICYLLEDLFEMTKPYECALAIAVYHTSFNLLTAIMLIGGVKKIEALMSRWFPVKEEDEDEFHLSFIEGGLLSTAELSVEEARKESVKFAERCQRMLKLTTDFVHMPDTVEGISHAYSRIEKYEKITDRLEMEIARYLNTVDTASLSEHIQARVISLFKVVDELESIGDTCNNIARTVTRRREMGIIFIKMQNNNIDRMLEMAGEAVDLMVKLMQKRDITSAEMFRVYNQEDSINNLRNQYREQNIGNIQSGYYSFQSGSLYMEIINGCEKLCDFVVNVLEAVEEQSDEIEEES